MTRLTRPSLAGEADLGDGETSRQLGRRKRAARLSASNSKSSPITTTCTGGIMTENQDTKFACNHPPRRARRYCRRCRAGAAAGAGDALSGSETVADCDHLLRSAVAPALRRHRAILGVPGFIAKPHQSPWHGRPRVGRYSSLLSTSPPRGLRGTLAPSRPHDTALLATRSLSE
jgi:hypothetical protein